MNDDTAVIPDEDFQPATQDTQELNVDIVPEDPKVIVPEVDQNFGPTTFPVMSGEQVGKVPENLFIIYYTDRRGREAKFRFKLLPAVEHGLFQTTIPNLRKGVNYTAQMQRAVKIIPGGMYVVQTVGIKLLQLFLCGIIESDLVLVSSPVGILEDYYRDVYTPMRSSYQSVGIQHSSYRKAQEILKEIIALGSVVTIEISNHDIQIKHKCYITDYQTFTTRADRTYYSFRCIVVDNIMRKSSDLTAQEEMDFNRRTEEQQDRRLKEYYDSLDEYREIAREQLKLWEEAYRNAIDGLMDIGESLSSDLNKAGDKLMEYYEYLNKYREEISSLTSSRSPEQLRLLAVRAIAERIPEPATLDSLYNKVFSEEVIKYTRRFGNRIIEEGRASDNEHIRLAKEQEGARIVALADAWNKLSLSNDVYPTGMKVDEITSGRGTKRITSVRSYGIPASQEGIIKTVHERMEPPSKFVKLKDVSIKRLKTTSRTQHITTSNNHVVTVKIYSTEYEITSVWESSQSSKRPKITDRYTMTFDSYVIEKPPKRIQRSRATRRR